MEVTAEGPVLSHWASLLEEEIRDTDTEEDMRRQGGKRTIKEAKRGAPAEINLDNTLDFQTQNFEKINLCHLGPLSLHFVTVALEN